MSDADFDRTYARGMMRSMFQTLFWAVIQFRKSRGKFTLQQIADALGINKSGVSRSLGYPSNWTIDKMADIADALGVDLIVEARDRNTGSVISTMGEKRMTSVNAPSAIPIHMVSQVTRTSADGQKEAPRKFGTWG